MQEMNNTHNVTTSTEDDSNNTPDEPQGLSRHEQVMLREVHDECMRASKHGGTVSAQVVSVDPYKGAEVIVHGRIPGRILTNHLLPGMLAAGDYISVCVQGWPSGSNILRVNHLAAVKHYLHDLQRGDFVMGTVCAISDDGVLMSVGPGFKTTVPRKYIPESLKLEEGQHLCGLVVLNSDSDSVRLTLSLEWEQLYRHYVDNSLVTAVVTDKTWKKDGNDPDLLIQTGLRLDVRGRSAFLPFRQLSQFSMRADDIVGRTLTVRVKEVIPFPEFRRNHLIVSEQAAMCEIRTRSLNGVHPDAICEGVVDYIADDGRVNVLLPGDVVVRVSPQELTDSDTPLTDVVSVGQMVKVKILVGGRGHVKNISGSIKKAVLSGAVVSGKVLAKTAGQGRVVLFNAGQPVAYKMLVPRSWLGERDYQIGDTITLRRQPVPTL